MIKTDTAALGTNRALAIGGSGSSGSGGNGGAGGTGRIRIEYCESVTGSTNPAASTEELDCYMVEQEERVEFDGKELLVVLGYGIIDSSCCGEGGCRYALVPGYILKWKETSDEKGRKITEVEPVRDEAEQKEIEKHLKEKEKVQQVNFW